MVATAQKFRAFATICLPAVALTLQACGFHPMLAARDANGGSVAGEFAYIQVASIDGRTGQVLRNDLVNALSPQGEPDRPKYTLIMRLEEPRQNLAFQRNNSISFVAYGVTAYWSLLDKQGKKMFVSVSSSSEQYAVSNSQYATAVSSDNTRDLVALDISQDIRTKLAQYFLSQKTASQKVPAQIPSP